MLIICPDCIASYEVDPTDVGSGRKVRCTQCGAVWKAEGDPNRVKPEPPPPPPPLAADPFDSISEVEEEEVSADFAPVIENDAVEDVVVEEKPGAKKKRRRGRGTAPNALAKPKFMPIMAAAGLTALVALGVWRDTIVGVVPDLAGLYALVGLPVNLRGLEFQDMNTVETMEGGVPLLVVRGTIANITESDVDVPRLRLSVRSSSGREIFVWTAMPDKPALKAGETVPFFARLASPPAEGREVAVRFFGSRDTHRAVQ